MWSISIILIFVAMGLAVAGWIWWAFCAFAEMRHWRQFADPKRNHQLRNWVFFVIYAVAAVLFVIGWATGQ